MKKIVFVLLVSFCGYVQATDVARGRAIDRATRSLRCTTPQRPKPKPSCFSRACLRCKARVKRGAVSAQAFMRSLYSMLPARPASQHRGRQLSAEEAEEEIQKNLVEELLVAIRARNCQLVAELAQTIDLSQAPVFDIAEALIVEDDEFCSHTHKLIEDGPFARMIRILAKAGLDFSKEPAIWAVVHEAVSAGLVSIVKALRDVDVDLNAVGIYGQTPLSNIDAMNDDYCRACLAKNRKSPAPRLASQIHELCATRRKRAFEVIEQMQALGALFTHELR